MNHLKQIAAGLDEYGLDAMLVTSAPASSTPSDSMGRAQWW